MSQRRGLRDFVPEVLNVAAPEVSNQGLLLGTSFAGNETQTLDFIEGPCVLLAGQLRWRPRTKFISACEGERSDLRPLYEVSWCEIRRRELVISRLVSRDIRRQSDTRSVGAAERQSLCGNFLSDGDAVCFVLSFRNPRQVLLKFNVERCLKRRVECDQDVMRRLVCRGWLRSQSRDVRETYEARTIGSFDVVDRVKDGSLQDGKTASRMNGGRLGAGSPQDHEESSIPLDDWIDRGSGGYREWFSICRNRSSRDLSLKTGAQESKGN